MHERITVAMQHQSATQQGVPTKEAVPQKALQKNIPLFFQYFH
ncbi:hypothetical protein [Sedimentimonas flavescens]|nr:hypothetical protein [Sedimentimonas flavescens]MCT2541239.1 hypothetical protein [Sedimentimonas flavescens]